MWQIRPHVAPPAFIAIWPRGGAKSASAEMACVALAARGVRRYGLYVCDTQDQADDHIATVASMLESQAVGLIYPDLAARSVGKYGNSKGWRRNRLRTAAGFTLDGIGLDVSARGAKLDADRPDLMIFDDVDDQKDTAKTTQKKLDDIRRKLLPAGTAHVAVIAVQNLIHPDGVFAQLVDGRADMLSDRVLSGPLPALQGFAAEQQEDRFVITAGEPIWAGQDVVACQRFIDTWGITAFRQEAQHEVEAPAGGMFDHLDFRHVAWGQHPPLVRVAVCVDPAVTDTDESDAHGVQVDGLGADGTLYRLFSWERRATPREALRLALRKAVEHKASIVLIETNQGRDTWESVWREACADEGAVVPMRQIQVSPSDGSKAWRATPMLADYEKGRVVHVIGTHEILERALRRFPKTKPFDLVDAASHSWRELMGQADTGVVQYRDRRLAGTR